MKTIGAFIFYICICISLVGCANNSYNQNNNISHNTFDGAKAILMVIKDHQTHLTVYQRSFQLGDTKGQQQM